MHRTASGRRAVKVHPETFKTELAKKLGKKDVSNQDIARFLGIGEAAVSRLLHGHQNLSEDLIAALAVELGQKAFFKVCDFGARVAA